MIALISPSIRCYHESISTLKFAQRAKLIKNEAKINENLDQCALLQKYERELAKLKQELCEKNKLLSSKMNLMKLEEEKRRAEEDKELAIQALEEKSLAYFREKEEKIKLEEKIKMMNSQLLVGGKKIEDTPQFRSALEEKQRIFRKEYEEKMNELEKERQLIVEDKAQVDRYKQLLLKQRDIMIALTSRLNERDETIVQLQEELEAYDRIQQESDDQFKIMEDRVLMLESILKSNNISIPEFNNEEILNKKVMINNIGEECQGRSCTDLMAIIEEQKVRISRMK